MVIIVVAVIRKAHTLFAENIITKMLGAEQSLLPLPLPLPAPPSPEHVIFWPSELRFTNHKFSNFSSSQSIELN